MSEFGKALKEKKKQIEETTVKVDATGYIGGQTLNDKGDMTALYVMKIANPRKNKGVIFYDLTAYKCNDLKKKALGKGEWYKINEGKFGYGGNDIDKYKTPAEIREFIAKSTMPQLDATPLEMNDDDIDTFLREYNGYSYDDDYEDYKSDDEEEEDEEEEDEEEKETKALIDLCIRF